MATSIELATNRIIKIGIPENVAIADSTLADLERNENLQTIAFFGDDFTEKEKKFFFCADAFFKADSQKGYFAKRPIAEAVGLAWAHDWLQDSTPTGNRGSVVKSVDLSTNVSSWATRNDIAEEYEHILRANRLLANNADVVAAFCVVADGVATFDATQLLKSGDTLTIRGIKYIVTSEVVEGLQYAISAPDAANTIASYHVSLKFRDWPKQASENIFRSIQY